MNALRLFHSISPLALLALAAAMPAACSQPQVRCTAFSGEATARYTLVGTVSKSCAGTSLPLSGAEDPSTFFLGIEAYVPSPGDPNAQTEPDSIAIKAEWLGQRIQDAQGAYALAVTANQQAAANDPPLPAPNSDAVLASLAALSTYPYGSGSVNGDTAPKPPPTGPKTTRLPYAFGTFTTVNPDENGICHVGKMNVSDLDYGDIPEHTIPNDGANDDPTMATDVPDQPDLGEILYTWTNFRFYVTPDSLGVQGFGDLTITYGDCTMQYHVDTLAPRPNPPNTTQNLTGCGRMDPATMNVKAEPSLCDPNPNGDDNPLGSGISEAVKPSCENIGSSTDETAADFECLPPKNDPIASYL